MGIETPYHLHIKNYSHNCHSLCDQTVNIVTQLSRMCAEVWLPRLTAPIPASMGPMRSQHDRSTIMQKCDAAWHVDDGDGNAVARDGPSQGGMKIMLCFLRAHWLRPMPYNRWWFVGALRSTVRNVLRKRYRRSWSSSLWRDEQWSGVFLTCMRSQRSLWRDRCWIFTLQFYGDHFYI